jgi:hypothetical protein
MPATKFTKPQLNLLRQVDAGTHELTNAPYMGRFGKGGPKMFCLRDQRDRAVSEKTFEEFKAAGLISRVEYSNRYILTAAGKAAINN